MSVRLQTIAWRDFVSWAINNPEMIAEFQQETGMSFPSPPKHAVEAMINDVTEVWGQVAEAFARWVTAKYWGTDGVPSEFLTQTLPEERR